MVRIHKPGLTVNSLPGMVAKRLDGGGSSRLIGTYKLTENKIKRHEQRFILARPYSVRCDILGTVLLRQAVQSEINLSDSCTILVNDILILNLLRILLSI